MIALTLHIHYTSFALIELIYSPALYKESLTLLRYTNIQHNQKPLNDSNKSTLQAGINIGDNEQIPPLVTPSSTNRYGSQSPIIESAARELRNASIDTQIALTEARAIIHIAPPLSANRGGNAYRAQLFRARFTPTST